MLTDCEALIDPPVDDDTFGLTDGALLREKRVEGEKLILTVGHTWRHTC